MSDAYIPKCQWQAEYLMVGGLRHRILRWGKIGAPQIWLLHGWMDCASSFQFMIDEAPDYLLEHELIAIDWRGFGSTQWQGRSYWFPDYLADLDALLHLIGSQAPVTLIGHSMGGIVANMYAGIRPERVARLVSLEGFGLPATHHAEAPQRLRRWLDQLAKEWEPSPLGMRDQVAIRLMERNKLIRPDRARWLAKELSLLHLDGSTTWRADPRHRIVNPILFRLDEALEIWSKIEAPTLWLTGNEVALLEWLKETPEQFGQRKAAIKHLQYGVIPHSGHNLHHDSPAALARCICEWLEQVQGQP